MTLLDFLYKVYYNFYHQGSSKKANSVAKLNITLPHALSQDEALRRIKKVVGEIQSEFGDRVHNVKEEWKENVGSFSFSAMGFSVSGRIVVGASEVKLSGTLPFGAFLFKEKIEAKIKEKSRRVLS